MSAAERLQPLVAHVLYRFDVGGLENGVVNLINAMPPHRYRHAVIALSECDPGFSRRLTRSDVRLVSMHKPPGHGVKLYPAFFRLMRELSPAIVHTRNLAALEMAVPAALAGVPVRVHGEHGWDSSDPEGRRRRFRWLRKAYSPFVNHYVALSGHLEDYLVSAVGLAQARVTRICNGVDMCRFRADADLQIPRGMPFDPERHWIFGTVGRLQEVKDQITLVRAFALLCAGSEEARQKARLVIAGDGPLRASVEQAVRDSGCSQNIWLAGARSDVPAIMVSLDCFVLPSRAEGISNTILEAMAVGLPVIATSVGGNPELVLDGQSGWLVEANQPRHMADAMADSFSAPQQSRDYGTAGRRRIEAKFSLQAMVGQYADLYDRLLAAR